MWTVASHVADRLRPPALAGGRPWQTVVTDRDAGDVELSGVYHAGSDRLPVVLVHGLGGSVDSGYVRRAAAAASERGHPVLRLNLRGADRRGADIYHAGLTADVRAALASAELAGKPAAVIGFSLGGHVTLRLAAERPAGLAAAVALCAPLDLAAGADHIDRRRSWIYRRHLLRGLREIHAAALAAGAPVPCTAQDAAAITGLREWDDRVVAPRFGFAGAADYYRQMSAGPVLGDIDCPALIAWAPGDPMVPPPVCVPPRRCGRAVQTRTLAPGGHVGFPRRLAVERSILDWIAEVT